MNSKKLHGGEGEKISRHPLAPTRSHTILVVGSMTTSRFEIAASWTYEPPTMGLPIMREGFVTETGLLPSSELLPGHLVC